MKPVAILKLIVTVNLFLFVLTLIIPGNGVALPGNIKISFASLSEIFGTEQPAVQDSITEIATTKPDTIPTATVEELQETKILDSLSIQHCKTSKKLFESFYRKITCARTNKELVRILHYGDSQIEADRISGTLREKMQETFGGSGIGWIPVTEISLSRTNISIEASDTWKRTDIGIKAGIKNGDEKVGLGGCIYNFDNAATIALHKSKQSTSLQQKTMTLKLLYGNSSKETQYELSENDRVTGKGILKACGGFGVMNWDLADSILPQVKIKLSGGDADVYGLTLDDHSGIAVDNVSLRGSSGVEFTKADSAFLGQQLRTMNVGMIVLQFGVNVVPNEKKDYSYFEKLFKKQLSMFRSIAPNAAILVIGVSDMSHKVKGSYASYANIPFIREAMRNAAFANDAAYWDLYAVMGGKNSMVSWVKAKPALANKDYTHFNNRGAEKVGEELYDAIMRDRERLSESLTIK